jgi:very-short-patch-repair endonuclease
MITYDILFKKYINDNIHIIDLAKEYQITGTIIRNLLVEYNIPIRTNKEVQCLDKTKNKSKETKLIKYGNEYYNNRPKSKITCLLLYNVDNVFKSDFFKSKIECTNLLKYGVKYATQSSIVKNKIIQTNLLKYGTEYGFQSELIKSKITQTNLLKYGFKCSLQNINVREKSIQTSLLIYNTKYPNQSELIKNKIKKTNLLTYGFEHAMKNKSIVQKSMDTRIKNGKKLPVSKISQELFFSIYEKLENKEHIYFGKLNKEFGRCCSNKKYYFFDFVDTNKKKIIEFNGDFWHYNPKIYDISYIYDESLIKKIYDIRTKEEIKLNEIRKEGYEILIVWENDYYKNKENILNQCLTFLNN